MIIFQKRPCPLTLTVRSASLVAGLLAAVVLTTGCSQPTETATPPTATPPKSIIGQKTQDIGEAEEGTLEADLTAEPGLLVSMGAYKSAVGKIAKMQIQQATNLFNAEHGRYPKDHDEFMAEIVKKNNLQLPVLPGKRRYQYDVKNHQLLIVDKANRDDKSEDTEN